MAIILVTGSNGQLGNEFRELALQSTHSFIFTDVAELDISDLLAISNFIKENPVHYIINCAAYTAVDKAESEIETAKLINATAPENLAAICKSNSIKFIHISTDYVFDGKNYKPYVETDIVNPQSVYGSTKLLGENLALQANNKTMIIRTSWLYSSFGNNFVKTMIRLGKEKESLGVIFDQIGTPTYAGDLAKTIISIVDSIEFSNTEFIPGIYHYSNEGACSWYDFAKEIHELTKVNCNVIPIETKDYPTPACRPHYSVLNKSKIKSTYNITIPHWKESLITCINKL